jgi:hypothetical protein
MTPEITEEQLIDYLYGEVDDEQRQAIEAYLDAHPDKREELESLSQARGILAQWEDEEPTTQVVFVTDRSRRFSRTTLRVAFGGAIAAAAALLLMFADFEVGIRDGRFHFTAGKRQSSPDSLVQESDRPLTVREFSEIQGEYFDLTQQLIEASELRQYQALARVAENVEVKRRQDLYYVGQGIQDVGRSAERGLQRASAIMTHLVEAEGSSR